MVDRRWRLLGRLRLYCNASCIAAMFAGSIILCGWVFHIWAFMLVFPGSGVMNANTALGLIFLGLSLWLLLPDPPRQVRRFLGLFFGILAASIGAITLIEFIFGVNLRFDQILYNKSVVPLTTTLPVRMAPSTASTLLALGLALLLVDWHTPRGRRPAQELSLWGALVAIMSLSGYIYKAESLYKFFSYSETAVNTAIILFLMSAAIFFARPRAGIAGDLTGRFMGSEMARRILPAVLVLPILLGWFRVLGQRAGLFGTELGLALNTTVNVATLSILLWFNARKLNKAEQSLEAVREAGKVHYDASVRDELTGLYNRRGFLTFAEQQIEFACSGRRELLVVFADVDDLKAINDGYGHQEGDVALKKTAEVLLTVFRDTDIVARMGGDEFAVLALDCSPAGLVRINAHFEKLLRTMNDLNGLWKLSISVGTIHVDSQHPLAINDLLSEADKMMYERKRARILVASK
jgi:diguanylate cyclase (GGDEF)-like protein